MGTSESECLEALRDAATRLGKSPTKAEYEALDISPASSSIRRVLGGWNKAKRRAGLETFSQKEGGSTEVQPKPESVDIPDGQAWEDLTPHQRCYYKNREHHIRRVNDRRKRLRRWFTGYKRENCRCERCGEPHAPALDFHHTGKKSIGVSRMVNLGYGRDRILEEIDQCEVICVNCHRLHHWERNDTAYGGCTSHHKDDRRRDLREWITQVKRDSEGCGNCAEERPILLDFHHPGEKEGTIARMVSTGQSVESIRSEIDRCELLCANCHRRLHHDDAF